MTDQLPRRPFTHLPPPPDGPATAVRVGRAIRRRRRVAGTSAAALSMALVAGVVIAAGSGSDHASDQLVPAVPHRHNATSATVAPTQPPSTRLGPAGIADQPGVVAAPAKTPAEATSARPAAAATAGPAAGPGAGYRTPRLRRTYQPPVPSGARLCTASVTTDGQGTRKRIDWCIEVTVAATDAGHNLTVTVCRDQTTDSALSFPSNLEADLAVVRGNRTVWRWSVGHATAAQAHALSTPAGACWSWTSAWTDVDGSGRPLASGSYDLIGSSLATQLTELPNQRTTFRIS